MNPGAATWTSSSIPAAVTSTPPEADSSVAESCAASASAIRRGGMRIGRASFIARLVARSPCDGSAGRSTSIRGRDAASTAGTVPARSARSQASARSVVKRERIERTTPTESAAPGSSTLARSVIRRGLRAAAPTSTTRSTSASRTGPSNTARAATTAAAGSCASRMCVRMSSAAPASRATSAACAAVRCIAAGMGSSVLQNASHRSVSPGLMSGTRSSAKPQSPLYTRPGPSGSDASETRNAWLRSACLTGCASSRNGPTSCGPSPMSGPGNRSRKSSSPWKTS